MIVDLTIDTGETLALVGESGCGKSITAFSLMGLVPPPGSISSGSVLLRVKNWWGCLKSDCNRFEAIVWP